LIGLAEDVIGVSSILRLLIQVLAAVGVGIALMTLRAGSSYDSLPIAGLVTTALALLVAIAVARYPELAPGITTDATVSPEATMAFLAVGVGLNVPLLVFYNWFAHHAFSGKLNSAPEPRDMPEAH